MERLIGAGRILLAAAVIGVGFAQLLTLALAMGRSPWVVAAGPRLSSPAPDRAREAREARERRLAGLQLLLERTALSINGRVSVAVRLPDGGTAGIDPERPVDAASLIKVPIMVALYEAWSSGALRRTRKDERRLRLMITRSRNIPANALIDALGMERINGCMAAHGCLTTRIYARILAPEGFGPNLTTAAEMARLMEQIQYRALLDPASDDEMRRLLLAQRWRERIPAWLPPGAVVGNKTGTMSNLLHDAAFVEAPNGVSYTIAVLIERRDRAACKSEAISALSREVYDYLVATAPPDARAVAARPR
jgi:beta-lactamase class A